jgi:putative transposase
MIPSGFRISTSRLTFCSAAAMARPLRFHLPGGLYHVHARGNDKQCIFTDDTDYERFLEVLGEALSRFRVTCVGFCQIWSHYHLVISPGELTISRMMQQLNSTYCQWFNRTHGRVGHVLQGRFAAHMIDSDSYLMTALRYVALNPVVAGTVSHPHKWRWSSYRATAGLEPVPAFLSLDCVWKAFDTDDPQEGQERFVTFVSGCEVDEALFNQFLIASRGFAKRIAPLLDPYQDVREFPYAHRFAARPPLEDVFKDVQSVASLHSAAREAFCTHAYTLSEIGKLVECAPSTVWRWVQNENARRGHRR